ncbi:FtsX-like permease family protein [Chitinophaga sp. SYP-B3965]|uniref:ABC transporter permease n=1 Tax=Chitinophaga sp. SYP-B3965 TaxID=2663120 RepID=UPI0012995A90|nr:ABC transporter permease [Chitinophaga sp. SYP-B3965]MRG45167.1 FtsX-like permease family protein [Chitinophaga sp. SYP-B3965]
MLKNYLTIACRNIWRNLGYVSLNVMGLTLSIASCLVIFLITKNELSYDSYHQKADRTYRVTMNALDFNSSVSMSIAPALRTDFPELEQVSQTWYQHEGIVKVNEDHYAEKGYSYADASFPRIFDLQWLAGNPQTALNEPNCVVLTESIAKKYFGSKDPIGQVIQVDDSPQLKVTGLIKDLPGNTHFPFVFLISFETVKKDLAENGAMENFFQIMGGITYIVLPEHYDIAKLNSRLPAFIAKHWGADIAKGTKLIMQPLKEIHFDQRYLNSITPTTSRNTYWALAAVALFIIITACINFVNLATAQAIKRAKEVGVRKALGANRIQLIRQFLGETSFLVFLAVIMGCIAAFLFLPNAALWLGVKIGTEQLFQPEVIGLLLALTAVIILSAGVYPAFVQSAFRPVDALKSGVIGISGRGLTLRKSLVFVQFTISQILIVGTLVVAAQMDYFKNQDLGFNKEAVISFSIPENTKQAVLREQLSANPGVKDISFSSGAPSYNSNWAPFSCPERGITKDDVTEIKNIDENFMDMFGIKLLAGEKLRKSNQEDTIRYVLVNETLIHKLGFSRPEEAIGLHFTGSGRHCVIQGVVQDFQSESKHKDRRPCILGYRPQGFFVASVKLQSADMRKTITRIETEWSAIFPEKIFQYEFLDDHIAAMYNQEQKVYTAFRLFSFLAILIGCLGLYGLVAFTAVQRKKEVGIRKVMGASLVHILALFAKEFFVLIIIAFLVAAPVAYFVMHSWLENFAYQVSISGGIFLIAIAVSFLIAAGTIAHQSLKAAFANPLKSLKAE